LDPAADVYLVAEASTGAEVKASAVLNHKRLKARRTEGESIDLYKRLNSTRQPDEGWKVEKITYIDLLDGHECLIIVLE
jgi:hypothetical protein